MATACDTVEVETVISFPSKVQISFIPVNARWGCANKPAFSLSSVSVLAFFCFQTESSHFLAPGRCESPRVTDSGSDSGPCLLTEAALLTHKLPHSS